MTSSVEVGDRVFFLHPEESWVIGTVRDIQGKVRSCEGEDGSRHSVQELGVHKVVESSLSPIHDLLRMSYLHDSTLLYHVRKRYSDNIIYTNIGPIVLALNPYDYTLPHYTDDCMPRYLEEGARALTRGSKQLPHSWSIAHQAYCLMVSKRENQSILVSGESGAGKTEAVKIVMKYVGELSTMAATAKQREIARQINLKVNKTSPILETFGNAKTTRNDNSSRFGKYMKLRFNSEGVLVGAHITPYLLEKSRVISHSQGERGYHSFYQLVQGASAEDRIRMRLGRVTDYKSLSSGKAVTIEGVNDAEEYLNTRNAMTTVGISKSEQDSLYNILAAVLHITNMSFREKDGRACLSDSDKELLEFVGTHLLKINPNRLYTELTTTTRTVAADTFTTSLDLVKATEQKASMCKTLYENIFLWLVGKINSLIDASSESNWIGLLDIFGFEHFEHNSFEQMCINLTNEQLQNHYNNFIFTKDLQECKDEGINTQSIIFSDNAPTLDLITSTLGVLSLLDEEVQLGKGSDLSFASKLAEAQGSHPSYVKHRIDQSAFGIRHYASTVMYNVDGWREKNMDTLKDSIKRIIRGSADQFVGEVIPPPVEIIGRKPTVSRLYKTQLQELMSVINATNPHWIRCVKPHHSKKPRKFSGQEVMNQLRSAGVLETVRIRKMGYSVRLSFTEFITRYRAIAGNDATPGDHAKTAATVLSKLNINSTLGQVGRTKVFLKSESWSVVEEARTRALNHHAVLVQKFAHLRRSRWITAILRSNKKVAMIQSACRSLLSQIYAKRTEYELRKESLLEGALMLQDLVREEERSRLAVRKLELDQMHHLGDLKRKDLHGLHDKWHRDRPMRDALEQSDFKMAEEGYRIQTERKEQEHLLRVLDVLKEDFNVMQQRQLQRERLEDEQRFRIAEQQHQEQRHRAQLLWARVVEDKRLEEDEQVAEEYRKWLHLQRVQDNIDEAKVLYSSEREMNKRVKRQFDQEIFCSSVPSAKQLAPRSRDKFSSKQSGAVVTNSDSSFSVPTFSRVSMAGAPQAGHLYSTTLPGRSVRSASSNHRTRSRSPNYNPSDPKTVKANPSAAHSLDMVKRLKKMSRNVQSNPYKLITNRYSPFNSKSPLNPSHPDWVPTSDGLVLLPDGSKYVYNENIFFFWKNKKKNQTN